jgi:hypothetical protein
MVRFCLANARASAAAAPSERQTYLGDNLGWKWKANGSSWPAVMTTNGARIRFLEAP